MEEQLTLYYENNAKKLHSMVDQIFYRKYGGTELRDMDEFYSVANDVFADIVKNNRYSKSKGEFVGFLYGALNLAIVDELKRQNCGKRTAKIDLMDENGNKVLDENGKPKQISIPDIYLDAPAGENESVTIGDRLPSDFNMDRVLFETEMECQENVNEFLNSLSEMQREIALLIMRGYEAEEIQNVLHITKKQYVSCRNAMKSYEKKRILYREDNREGEKMNTITMEENVTEKYKNTSYSIASISKQLKKKRIRDDHILQRHSGQWRGFAKSELVSDILRGKSLTQIIISEEIKNGIKMQWLIDGKQRCTTLDDYLHDGFPISKNVKSYNITYQAPKTDGRGKEILSGDGFLDMEWKTCDIRGKKFSQLPEELQDIFKDRQIPVLYNMDCTKRDIADDIARFNRSRPMNKAQNGWLGLEEGFAEFVENIANMQFFQPEFTGSAYTKSSNTSGTIRRIIVESIMTADFIEHFGNFDKMCEFLSKEASDSNFTEFYALVERLTEICNTKETASFFNKKDSFLWFGLFSRFTKLGLEDNRFAGFINQFGALRRRKIDGKSFDDILEEYKATKDKSVVMKKLDHMEKLMMAYLGMQGENRKDCDSVDSFIAEVLHMNVKTVREDMELYNESLDVLLEKTVRLDSRLREEENRPSLLAMMAYSYKEDKDLDEWMLSFAKNRKTYFADRKKNFLYMKKEFERYCTT